MHISLLLALAVTLLGGDATPEKLVRLYAYECIPGQATGDTLTSIHGFKVITSGQPLVIDLPVWLTRPPSAKAKEEMTPEQRRFWELASAEAAILAPLATKRFELRAAHDAALRRLKEAQDPERKQDPKTKASRVHDASAAAERASNAFEAWRSGPESAAYNTSFSRLAKIWLPELRRYNPKLYPEGK